MAEIRRAGIEDAARLITLFKKLDEETSFMLFEPRERKITVDEQADRLKVLEKSSTDAMFVAESGGILIGFVVGISGTANRNRHAAHVAIGVLRGHWNKGVGTKLLQRIELWGKAIRLHRLELTVMTHNAHAVALYEKCGFEREGIKRDSLRVGGKYVSEIYMSKLIGV